VFGTSTAPEVATSELTIIEKEGGPLKARDRFSINVNQNSFPLVVLGCATQTVPRRIAINRVNILFMKIPLKTKI
jgi:hypothetical protein